MKARKLGTLVVMLILLGAAAAARMTVGGEPPVVASEPVPAAADGEASETTVDDQAAARRAAALELRLFRLAAAGLVGAGLAVAGVLLQSLLRNPLASPELLGLSSGSSFAVMLATYLNFKLNDGALELWGGGGLVAPAIIGAVGALALVYALSQRKGLIEPVSMILVGVVVSVIFGAATVFCQSLMPPTPNAGTRWLMGQIDDDVSRTTLIVVGGVVALFTLIAFASGKAMDVASMSEDESRSSGVSLGPLRMWQFIGAGALTAGTVVIAGPIGFVGLVCPHVVRLMAGPGHRTLVLGSALAGAALIVGGDALVKSDLMTFGSGRVPIGVLTAILGGPIFLIMLRRQRGLVGAIR